MTSGKWIGVAGLAVVFAILIAVLVTPPIKNHDLAVELIRMEAASRATAFSTAGPLQLGGIRRAAPDFDKARAANAQRIKKIVDKFGWPTKSMVGAEASHDAWLIAQSVDDPAFITKVFALMSRDPDDVYKGDLALLTDRVASITGQPQTYGTQFWCRDNRLQPFTPIKDPAHLNERRRAVGLGPFDQDLRGFDTKFGGCGPSQGDAPVTTIPFPPKS